MRTATRPVVSHWLLPRISATSFSGGSSACMAKPSARQPATAVAPAPIAMALDAAAREGARSLAALEMSRQPCRIWSTAVPLPPPPVLRSRIASAALSSQPVIPLPADCKDGETRSYRASFALSAVFLSPSTTPGRPCIWAAAISLAPPARPTARNISSNIWTPPPAATMAARMASEPNRMLVSAWNSSSVILFDAAATCSSMER
ncbi:Uncharacterised protein [Mycobacteroides abscessus subsp. bolletii]|nr:Uncharacterised protein [Mycobacteroides abscessus subsp. bolletii]